MRLSSMMLVAVLAAGCAAHPVTRTPERRAANIAAAESAGYKVIHYGDRVVFCPTAPPTGSHIGSMCLSESEWEAALGAPAPAAPSVHVTNQAPGPGPNAGH
ncbi:MAG TPA: hypothetical protein VET46_12370 [Steroidobacteraceae bacterium]|nr:hypothetical protein [Steroidobacteraceae bacterium]